MVPTNNFGKKIRDETQKRLEKRGLRKRNARPQLDGGAGLSSRRNGNGSPGPPGPGVAPGGAPDQVLIKRTATDFDTEWRDPIAGDGGGVTQAYVDDAARFFSSPSSVSVGVSSLRGAKSEPRKAGRPSPAADALRMLKSGDAMSGDLTVNGAASADQTTLSVVGRFVGNVIVDGDLAAIYLREAGGDHRYALTKGPNVADLHLQTFPGVAGIPATVLIVSRQTQVVDFAVRPTVNGTPVVTTTELEARIATLEAELARLQSRLT